jgi:acetyltransferase-like isoleucine patch superfamily enzyme
MMKKLEKLFFFSLIKIIYYINMEKSTKLQIYFYKKHGMNIQGTPRYISAKTLFDGTDYSLITLGDGVIISSNIRILTHDWAIDTVHLAFSKCDQSKRPIGRLRSIKIGDHSFIGTGSIIMPGCQIGKGVIIGAGSVVRGEIPDFSIVVGNSAKLVGDSIEYCKNIFNKIGCDYKEL